MGGGALPLARPQPGEATAFPEREVPSPDEEYLLYQTLIGAWPFGSPGGEHHAEFIQRIQEYLVKALKEAKINTSWINPDEEYEQGARAFIAAILDPAAGNEFFYDCAAFCKRVDPDSRRPVDYARRRALLAAIRQQSQDDPAALCDRLLQDMESGAIKLYITSKALELRKANQDLFADGAYEPLPAIGEQRRHVIAFARSLSNRRVVVVAARFFCGLGLPARPPLGTEVWSGCALALPDERAFREYRDVFTGNTIRVQEGGTLDLAEALARLPVALLERLPG